MYFIQGNLSLHYEEILPNTPKDDPIVLLFLHEALGSIGQWKDFPAKICEECGLTGIVYERQGHGRSSGLTEVRTKCYLHDYALKELPAFIDGVIPENKKIILIGHSDGGTISLIYAAHHPERIAGIVTLAAHVVNEPETISGIQPAIEAYQEGKLEGLVKYHGDKTDALFRAWSDIWRSESFKDWNISHEIGDHRIQGLFIQGAEDQYGTPRQLELIRKNYSGKVHFYMVEACGHHPHLEQADRVSYLISEWIKNIVSESSPSKLKSDQ